MERCLVFLFYDFFFSFSFSVFSFNVTSVSAYTGEGEIEKLSVFFFSSGFYFSFCSILPRPSIRARGEVKTK